MPAEELGLKYFTRDRIRTRMLKRAAEVWGFSESEMDEFDPLVSLLIEASAVEFERTAAEIGKTQNRMLERLAQLMYPEVATVYPSYGIMQAQTVEPDYVLNISSQFLAKGSAVKGGNPSTLIYFSPARETRLVNGSVRVMATCREIYTIEEGVQKIQIATSNRISGGYQHSLWLGVALDDEVDSLQNISFFFNWLNDAEAETWYQFLPYAQWYLQKNFLHTQQGLPGSEKDITPAAELQQEYDIMKRIEDEVCQLYNGQFVTIAQALSLEKLKLQPEPYPALFNDWFDKKDLNELKEPLMWIEIKFPTLISPEALDSVLCGINCFPVINRKLNRLPYKLQQSLNIVPLEAEGSFLAVKEISTTSGGTVKLAPFANPYDLQPESYALRYGVNRFNERNSYDTLVNLLDLIREESSFFSSLGEDFLAQHVRELNQILARMESKIKMQNKHAAPFPFLAINKGKEGGNVMIKFWTCVGSSANKIPMGTRLMSYQLSSLKTDEIFMVTTTAGGKDNMSDAEKLVQYKKALFTRNRIVTPEDVRTVVLAELGKSVRSVKISKGFMKGTMTGSGFVRCIEVLITPVESERGSAEWENKLSKLKVVLEQQSANNIPFHLVLNK